MRCVPTALLLLWASAQGCTSLRVPAHPPSEEVRAQLGVIRIEVVPEEPEPGIEHPPGGSCQGFSRGMGHGANLLFSLLPREGGAGVEVVFLAPMPVLSLVYGFIGMFRSMPSEDLESLEKPIQAAFVETPVCLGLRTRLLEETRSRAGDRILGSDDLGSADTVLRVELVRKDLSQREPMPRKMKEFLDPDFLVQVRAHVRLIRVADGEVLYEGLFQDRSELRTFGEWMRDDGQAVRRALSSSPGSLAANVARTLFEARAR